MYHGERQVFEGDANGTKVRLITAAEVNFILAEAAQGWNAGDAEERYNAAITASFNAWGIAAQAPAYLAGLKWHMMEHRNRSLPKNG